MLDLDFCLSFLPSPPKNIYIFFNKIYLFYLLGAVTSTKGIKRLSKAERTDILLPEVTKDILVGILLGEGHLFISPKTNKVEGCLYSNDLGYFYTLVLYCFSSKIKDLKLIFYFINILILYFIITSLYSIIGDLFYPTSIEDSKDVCSYLCTASVAIYSDVELQKASILAENKGRSGIYLWINKVNGKCYVGSSVDLGTRFINYFNRSYLMDLVDVMLIYKALLAHGFYNFTLEILEICAPDKNIRREQYYLDKFKPEYNRFFLYPQATKKNYIIYYIYNMLTYSWFKFGS
jgi:hypothetical protein